MQETIKQLDGALLARFLRGGCAYLGEHKEEVNALNVFPVPDGDTGINMFLTVNSAAAKLPAESPDLTAGQVAAAFSTGTLMGARGNSGVILSQIFRGIAVSLGDQKKVDAKGFAAAFQKGVDLSYKSVMKPVEGTILTVFREFSAAAEDAARAGADVVGMLVRAAKAGEKALARTPELLPVLKEAGVVDAGGKGLLVFMEGALGALTGEYIETVPVSAPTKTPAETPRTGAAGCDADIEFAFCTQLLIHGDDLPLETIREHLSQTPPGDSLLVVGDEHTIKIHFHNNRPWEVLEYCAGFGTIHDIIIDNMRDQHHEIAMSSAEQAEAERAIQHTAKPAASKEPAMPCGVIAVCSGDAMIEIYRQLGATVISGGQTMNPSAEDLLQAVEACPADEVVILPNNGNIVMAATQAQQLAKKPVEVVRTKYVTQGLSAMMGFDPSHSAEENSQAMTEAGAATVNGELTYAVRGTKINGFSINDHDVLALLQGDIVDAGPDLSAMLLSLVEKMTAQAATPELLSLFYGNGMQAEEAQALADQVQERFPDLEVELQAGGQPLYYFLVSLE